MKPVEIRELTDDELSRKENETREELFNLKVQLVINQTTNVSRIGKLKKDLARLITVRRERQLATRRN